MSIQTKNVFLEKIAEWSKADQIRSTRLRSHHSPTLTLTIQGIFPKEDANWELSAMRFEIEAIYLLPHRFFLSYYKVKNG